jgi:hypothetical protein
MLNSEKAFDMLPFVVDIYDKLDMDNYRKKAAQKYEKSNKEGKPVSQLDAGIEAFKYVMKNSTKVKEEFFAVVASFEDKTVEEVKAQPFAKTLLTFKTIFTDPELTNFFKEAMQ